MACSSSSSENDSQEIKYLHMGSDLPPPNLLVGSVKLFNKHDIKNSRIDGIKTCSKQEELPTISTDSCNPGDMVFIVWNIRHKQFIIVQETPSLYFVHGDCLNQLNLKLPKPGDLDVPKPFHILARVVSKDYCEAVKSQNRYKVAKGTKFHLVMLEPFTGNKGLHKLPSTPMVSKVPLPVDHATATIQKLIESYAQIEHKLERFDKDSIGSPSTSSSSGTQVTQVDNFREYINSLATLISEENETIFLTHDEYPCIGADDERALIVQPSCLNRDSNLIYQELSNTSSTLVDGNNHYDIPDGYSLVEIKDDGNFLIIKTKSQKITKQ